MYRILLAGICFSLFLLLGQASAQPTKPLSLPMALPPGLETWFMGQPYGNTTSAYNFGAQWYAAGQGLHFGMDFPMPCGTPLVAMADGEVYAADASGFGSAPHNLLIVHPEHNLVVLYGHLLERPTLVKGQPVKRGDFVGLSGDPDEVCTSRPHLHLEVRSRDFSTTYNPVDYIDAPWHVMAAIGAFSYPLFQQDLDNPRRWMSLDEQPPVRFGGARLNNYTSTIPYPLSVRPPVNPPLFRELDPLPAGRWELRQLGNGGCCRHPWWHPRDSNLLYFVDGVAGQRASVFEVPVDLSGVPVPIQEAPPMLLSPDGSLQVTRANGQVVVRDLQTQIDTIIPSQGMLPGISADNSRLLWEVWRSNYLPGGPAQTVETWISDIDGGNPRMIWLQAGGWAVWLDGARVLIVTPLEDDISTTLTVYDTRDDSHFELGTWRWLRNMSVAPGGGRLMFWRLWQENPQENGMYSIDTQPGAVPQKMPWFGAWRWRDAKSVFYLPFDVNSPHHILAYYNLETGEDRYLTDAAAQLFTVANGDWAVAANGNRLVFSNAADLNMWLLEAPQTD